MRPVQVVLLAEDEQLACFVRYFLEKYGYSKWDWRVVVLNPGEGSGEQFVRQKYPAERKAIRAKKKVLIVLTDADAMTVKERIATLQKECEEQNVKEEKRDRVLFIVPKRNIETWLAYLRGETVDENSVKPYRKYDAESKCRPEVDVLHTMCEAGALRKPAPPSLELSCKEWKKMRLGAMGSGNQS